MKSIIILIMTSLWKGLVSTQNCLTLYKEMYKDENLCPQEYSENFGESLVCSDWCNNTLTEYEVLNKNTGRVRVFISAAPSLCKHTSYMIVLQIAQVEMKECVPGIPDYMFKDHTEFEVAVNSNSSTCSNKVNSLVFEYVFTGCYQIILRPSINSSRQQPCNTSPFKISTELPFEVITNPKFNSISKGPRTLVASFYWNQTFNMETVLECVEVNLYQNFETTMTCFLARFEEIGELKRENCSCKWMKKGDLMEMKCYFYNLNSGDYNIEVMAFDTRCVADTIWTQNIFDSTCVWENNLSFTATNGTNHLVVDPNNFFLYLYWITGVVVCLIPSSIIVYIIMGSSKKPQRTISHKYAPVKTEPIKGPGITRLLLLYPRDCQAFMNAMASFRRLLHETGKFEVLDALDPEQYDNVAANINVWGLNHISCPSTKVILVASWCSLKLYQALLDRNKLSYKEPQAFDNLFTLHVSNLFLNKEPYKKIFVIRLDCNNVKELSFEYLAQCRVFTLPQCTETLFSQLLELGSECKIVEKDGCISNSFTKFQDSISIYSKYLKENPEYLNNYLTDSDIH